MRRSYIFEENEIKTILNKCFFGNHNNIILNRLLEVLGYFKNKYPQYYRRIIRDVVFVLLPKHKTYNGIYYNISNKKRIKDLIIFPCDLSGQKTNEIRLTMFHEIVHYINKDNSSTDKREAENRADDNSEFFLEDYLGKVPSFEILTNKELRERLKQVRDRVKIKTT